MKRIGAVDREVRAAIDLFRNFKEVAEKIKADHAVIFNGRFSISLPAINACEQLGISYSTIKQWILTGKLKTVQTPGGHHRIDQPERQINR